MPHSERVAVSQGKCGCGFGAWTSQAFPGPPDQQPPCWAPPQANPAQWANSSAQPSSAFPGRDRAGPACLCAVWPAWGWGKGGSARGSPGRWGRTPGDWSSSSTAGTPPPPPQGQW